METVAQLMGMDYVDPRKAYLEAVAFKNEMTKLARERRTKAEVEAQRHDCLADGGLWNPSGFCVDDDPKGW